MRLSLRDFEALQRAILELHAHLDMEAFRDALPGIVMRLIACDYFSVVDVELDPSSGRFRSGTMLESHPRMNADLLERMERYGSDHPFTQYSLRTRDPSAIKFSDFFTTRELHRSGLYQEFYRHADIEHLLGVISFNGRRVSTINFARPPRSKDFSDRDRALLNLLLPHFEQARRQVTAAENPKGTDSPPLESYGLTLRETEVARWLAQGKTNLEIGVILQTSVRTVEKHVERILVKLGVENRTTAATLIVAADRGKVPFIGADSKRKPLGDGPSADSP